MPMKRVLIVDDALDLGRVLQTLMQTVSSELSITVTPSAEEAVLEAGRKPVDLLVSDIRLPGISGLELVKKIRLRNPDVKVIFITALSDGPVVRQARSMNADGFFFKPLDFSDFLAVARKCLGLVPPPPPQTGPLVKPVPEPAEAVEPKPERLSDLIAGLRQSLGALAVFVLNDSGHVIAQAGDLPMINLETDWAPTLFTSLSAAAKVARLVKGTEGGTVQAFTGQDFDLALAPIGMLALAAVLKKGRASLRLGLAFEELLAAQKELKAVLGEMGIQVQAPTAPEPEPKKVEAAAELPMPPDREPDLEKLETIIKESAAELKPEEVDAFWDSLPEPPKQPPENPDVITYDQASKLGLTPSEPKK